MNAERVDAAWLAVDVLLDELGPVLGGRRPDVNLEPSTGARDWAGSGAMCVTRSPGGPPRLSPGAPASWARAAAALLGRAELDGAALLSERAALAQLGGNGPYSPGGAFRAYRARDGWLGLSLARPGDIDLVPALIEGAPDAPDVQAAVARWAAGRPAAAAEERARLLGLPAAIVQSEPQVLPGPAVWAERGGPSSHRNRPVVVDLSALWAGPLCAQLLGQAGARVVKVESTARPDGARGGNAAFYDLLHGGHEAVALDFGSPIGRQALRDLVAWADVIIEASRPRALARLGLDAAEFVGRGAVWVSITAYGRSAGDRVGFGDDVAAAAGLVVDDGAGPYPVGDAVADPLAGITAAAAAIAALRSGYGWLLDVSMRDIAAHAAALPGGDAVVAPSGRHWCVTGDGWSAPVRVPRARPISAAAAQFGAQTDAVLADVRSGVSLAPVTIRS